MDETKVSAAIEFLGARKSFGKDGSPRAQYWYVFRVGEKLDVNVFVHFALLALSMANGCQRTNASWRPER